MIFRPCVSLLVFRIESYPLCNGKVVGDLRPDQHDGFYATYETGLDLNRRFDAHIEVFGSTKQLKVQYNTPYIRHLPTTLQVSETVGEAFVEQVHRPTFKDPYTIEMELFHEAITQDLSLKTTPEDYKQDLTIFKMMVDQMLITYKPQ